MRYFFVLVFILTSSITTMAVSIDSIEYIIDFKPGSVESLELRLEHRVDNINKLNTSFFYDGEDLRLAEKWKLNFIQRQNYNYNLNLILFTKANDLNFGKGIGVSGDVKYLTHNFFYWDLDYIFYENDDYLVYDTGLALPMTSESYLKIGLRNSYWNPDDSLLNLGIAVEI